MQAFGYFILLALPFLVLTHNAYRVRQKEHTFLFFLSVASTGALLCAVVFTTSVFARGWGAAMLKRVAPGSASLGVLITAISTTLAVAVVSAMASVICLCRRVRGWQTIFLSSAAVALFEALLLFQVLIMGDWLG